MKRIELLFLATILLGSCTGEKDQTDASSIQEYEANWESLRQWENPQWSLDAKFGLYAHWGPYTQTGAWRDNPNINWGNYYITAYQGIYNNKPTEARRTTFEKRYGSILEGNGYRDLCETFLAEGYDAKELADIMERSGAHYAGICAIHHDGYAMWDSEVTPHCAGKTGPKRDLLGEILSELKKRDIKTIASFHHARTYRTFNGRAEHLKESGIKGVDITDPKNHDYYWFLGTEERFIKNRKALTYEVIDKYLPDMLWFDGGGGGFQTEEILAYYFNNALKNNQEVALHNKGNFGDNFGIYSYENGAHRSGFVEWPWSDDTPSAVGWCDWPWWYGMEYKKPRDVVIRLADLVARNGGLLLSLNPRPDGSLDKGQIELLDGIGSWLKENDEAIYGTRPWIIYAEGHVEPIFWQDVDCPNPGGSFGKEARPIQPDTKQFDETDIRFTAKGNVLYAIQLAIPGGNKTIIKSLGTGTELSSRNKIRSIELLGYGEVAFNREADKLEIDLPEQLPNDYALAFKIEVKGDLKQRPQPDKSELVTRTPEQL